MFRCAVLRWPVAPPDAFQIRYHAALRARARHWQPPLQEPQPDRAIAPRSSHAAPLAGHRLPEPAPESDLGRHPQLAPGHRPARHQNRGYPWCRLTQHRQAQCQRHSLERVHHARAVAALPLLKLPLAMPRTRHPWQLQLAARVALAHVAGVQDLAPAVGVASAPREP